MKLTGGFYLPVEEGSDWGKRGYHCCGVYFQGSDIQEMLTQVKEIKPDRPFFRSASGWFDGDLPEEEVFLDEDEILIEGELKNYRLTWHGPTKKRWAVIPKNFLEQMEK